jgi:hypothetical protein
MTEFNNNTLIAFKYITKLITELSNNFSKQQKSLALYGRLIEKTTIMHEKPITKHVSIFKDFCVQNREAIEQLDKEKFSTFTLSYSDHVYIDLQPLFKLMDKQTEDSFWKYLLAISSTVDPESQSKKVLKQLMEEEPVQEGEGALDVSDPAQLISNLGIQDDFLQNMISKVSTAISPDQIEDGNPMNAISSIMSSSVFPELISDVQAGINSGQLNVGKLMSIAGSLMKMPGN